MNKLFFLLIGICLSILCVNCNNDVTAEVKITPDFIEEIQQYDELYAFSEGLAAVRKNGRFGFINTKGKLVIPLQYHCVGPCKEGLICVTDSNNKIHFINRDDLDIKTEYSLDGGYYFGNSGLTYADYTYFRNGVIELYVLGDSEPIYLDTKGNKLEDINSLDDGHSDNNPFYVIFEKEIKHCDGRISFLHGIKNKEGKIIADPVYNEISNLSNGVFNVIIDTAVDENGEISNHIGDSKRYFGYIDTLGNTTFTQKDWVEIKNYRIAYEKELKESVERWREEEQRIRREGPDWLQGKWEVNLTDDYGRSFGTMYSTFNHGTLTIEMGDMVFDYPYTLSEDLTELRFSNDGKYYLIDEKVISANGMPMTKISSSASSNSSSNSPSYNSHSYQNNKELEIMNKLKELGEKGRAMLPKIEQLYRSQQAYGIGGNPEAHFSLREALDELLKIKDQQIRLAQQLGDAQLVKEYKEQRNKVRESADLMLYGRSGSVQIPY